MNSNTFHSQCIAGYKAVSFGVLATVLGCETADNVCVWTRSASLCLWLRGRGQGLLTRVAGLTFQTGPHLLQLPFLGHLQELGELAEAEHRDDWGGQVQQGTAALILLVGHH